MADISKISLPNGTTYNIKDSNALTDDVFNMTPIGVTYDEEHDTPPVLDSDGLPLVAHNRPILIGFGEMATMFYYMNDAVTGSTYEGCKFYSSIAVLWDYNPDTGEILNSHTQLTVIAINPQNGNIYFILSKEFSNN